MRFSLDYQELSANEVPFLLVTMINTKGHVHTALSHNDTENSTAINRHTLLSGGYWLFTH